MFRTEKQMKGSNIHFSHNSCDKQVVIEIYAKIADLCNC